MILISIGTFLFSFLDKLESLWSLKKLIFTENNNIMEHSIIYLIYQSIFPFLIGIATYIILIRLKKNKERTNIFHWIYNYRFEMIEDYFKNQNRKGEKTNKKRTKKKIDFFSEKELKFMIKKIKSKYPHKSKKEIIDLLKPHYSKYLNKEEYKYLS